MALLVIQNKKTIMEPSLLEICKFIHWQDITSSDTPKKSTSNVEDKGCKSGDGGGKPKASSSPVQKQRQQRISPEFESILTDNIGKLPTSANTTQQFLGPTQGLHNVDKSQFET